MRHYHVWCIVYILSGCSLLSGQKHFEGTCSDKEETICWRRWIPELICKMKLPRQTLWKWPQRTLKEYDDYLFFPLHFVGDLQIQVRKPNGASVIECRFLERFTLLFPWLLLTSLRYSLYRSQVTNSSSRLSSEDKREEDTSQDGSMSSTVPESRTNFQAELLRSPSRETQGNLRPVMPPHRTRCPFTPTSFPFIQNLFSLSPFVRLLHPRFTPHPICVYIYIHIQLPLPSLHDGWAPLCGVAACPSCPAIRN